MMDYILALDQGTSSSRSMVFDARGKRVGFAQQALSQHYPAPGWVEHDAEEIWATQLATARLALQDAGIRAAQVRALAITNQRETTVLWDRASGRPLAPAIVWQDRRTEAWCDAQRAAGLAPLVKARTGLELDPYFCASKLCWLLDHIPGARARAERGELAFGTVDSWLLWRLTGGRVHASDVSNASRTLLYDIHQSRWSDELLAAFHVPAAVLPEVLPSAAAYGQADAALLGHAIPIAAVVGDQQAALVGQLGLAPGVVKNTYGTGCFMLMHTGERAVQSRHRLITTRAAQLGGQAAFALEGSVFVGGAVVQWLRDGLGIIQNAGQVEALARSVPDSGGVTLVPAFTGLGAPHWDAAARGTLTGLTRGSSAAHIARAALEAIAFQSADLLTAMRADVQALGTQVSALRVDGGASRNDLLMQMQADVLGLPVLRPEEVETTALGAAYLAGLGQGLWQSPEELAPLWRLERRFEPQSGSAIAEALPRWQRALRQARAP